MSTKRLTETFMELVKIDSESFNEGKIQADLINRFKKLGLTIIEDDSMKTTGLGSNNFIARLEGDPSIEPLFFSSHMDTVSPGNNIKPSVEEGKIVSDRTTILGADDKAGIAIMLELIQRLKEKKIRHGTLEFILTAGEEVGLLGAKVADMNSLQSNFGYVLDNGGPVGGIITTSPSMYRIDLKIVGRAAHAGLEPEKGISAIEVAADAISKLKFGRIDHETTANIGKITGGTAMNIVMEEITILAEVRSFNHEKCKEQVNRIKKCFEEAIDKYGAILEWKETPLIIGYDFQEQHPLLVHAKKALESLDHEVRFERSGGGTDANVFNELGKQVINVSIGYENIHTIDEYIPINEFENAVEFSLKLISTMFKFNH